MIRSSKNWEEAQKQTAKICEQKEAFVQCSLREIKEAESAFSRGEEGAGQTHIHTWGPTLPGSGCGLSLRVAKADEHTLTQSWHWEEEGRSPWRWRDLSPRLLQTTVYLTKAPHTLPVGNIQLVSKPWVYLQTAWDGDRGVRGTRQQTTGGQKPVHS